MIEETTTDWRVKKRTYEEMYWRLVSTKLDYLDTLLFELKQEWKKEQDKKS